MADQVVATCRRDKEVSWHVQASSSLCFVCLPGQVLANTSVPMLLLLLMISFYKTRNDFVQSFSPNSQVEGYMYAVRFLQSQGDLPDQPFGGVYVDASLVHKTSFYYKRIPVYYDDMLVAEWLDDVRYWHKCFQDSRSDGVFPRATNNCFNKYAQCSYLHLCRTQPSQQHWNDTFDAPEGFVADEWKPYDTKEIETS